MGESGRVQSPAEVLAEAAKVLRLEALLARESPRGKHPRIEVFTHAAALTYAASLLDDLSTPARTPSP